MGFLIFLRAVLALKQSKTKVEAILQGKDLIMTFHGIGQFNNQVIYVKMSEENQKMLCRIAGKCLIWFFTTSGKLICRDSFSKCWPELLCLPVICCLSFASFYVFNMKLTAAEEDKS